MKIRVNLAALLLLVAVQANASIYEYTYTGNTLFPGFNAAAFGYPAYLPAFSGVMKIDEKALDGDTLVDSTISFSVLPGNDILTPFGQLSSSSEIDGLLAFDVFSLPPTASSSISFTTDSDRNIVSWYMDFLDGPPDSLVSSVFGDFIEFTVNENLYSGYYAAAGTWSAPTVIPVPGAVWLFGTALIGLIGFSKRRQAS